MARLSTLLHSKRSNAAISWLCVGAITSVSLWSLLSGDPFWGGFTLLAAAVVAAPPIITCEWILMIPWPLAAVVVGASVTGALEIFVALSNAVGIATLALVLLVELSAFTSVLVAPTDPE